MTAADDNNEGLRTSITTVPPTDMLYMTYEGNWLTECDAKVVSVQTQEIEEGKVHVNISLDQTVLHAQGGGQPTDVGSLTGCSGGEVQVTKVTMDRETGIATHSGTIVAGEEGRLIQTGDTVKVSVDKDVRRILSECHTVGHVVDSAMARCGLLLKPSKGYHFLDGPYVEYQGKIPPEEQDELLNRLQSAFCELVNENIDTKIELMSKNDADAVCNRQAQNFDMEVFADKRTDLIRVVTVAGFPCPCGGTHVQSTADLKENQWGITGIKSKKNVVRVKYGQKGTK